jgi:hypothetical protein
MKKTTDVTGKPQSQMWVANQLVAFWDHMKGVLFFYPKNDARLNHIYKVLLQFL